MINNYTLKMKNKLKTGIFMSKAILAICLLFGCKGAPPPSPREFKITSNSFFDNGTIPDSFSCKAGIKQKFPNLDFHNIPENTQSMAIIMDDPDAISVVGYIWTHWLVYNIPTNTKKIGPGANNKSPLPIGVLLGKTSSGDTVYEGPCPPSGQLHRYKFRLFALNKTLPLGQGATAKELRTAMQGAIIDSTIYTGVFKQ